jgi:hypothetical protein
MILKKLHTVKVYLLLVLITSMPAFLSAQVSIIATSHVVQPNEDFKVDIKAVNFTNVLTCQFSISWDSTAFKFLGTEGLAPAFVPYPFNHFGFSETDSSKMGFSWADLTLASISLSDSSRLFSIKFRAIKEESGDYAISFGSVPTAVEIADVDENVLGVEFHEGHIRIDGISGQSGPAASEYLKIYVAPNPFRGNTQVEAEFLQAVPARIRLNSPDGRLLFEESRVYPSGRYDLLLPEGIFAQPGVYWLSIQGKDFSVTHKLIAL